MGTSARGLWSQGRGPVTIRHMNSITPVARSRYEAAVRAHRAGRLPEAVAGYEELLRQAPTDADVLQLLGTALAQLGRHADGARFLARSLDIKPDRPSVLLNLARALHTLGRQEDALRCCDRVLLLDRSIAEGYRIRGGVLADLGHKEQSLANFGEAVRLAPQNAAAHVDLGTALDAQGRTRDALECFERAVVLDPKLAEAHHQYALAAMRVGYRELALESFDRALQLQPQNPALHSNRGNALKELNQLREALQSYSLALAIEPGNAATLHNRAAVRNLLGDYADALRDYEQLATLGKAQAPDLVGRGIALLGLGRTREALEPLERAVTLLPNEANAHAQLGVTRLRLERYAEAVESFDRALAIQADLPEVSNNRAIALMWLDRSAEALSSLERALASSTGTAEVHTNKGTVLRTLGRSGQAAASFRRALALAPGDAAASFSLGLLHLSLGEFREGWPLYENRFRVPGLGGAPTDFRGPRWDGTASLEGKTLLVYAEQGFGDVLQFCRYLPLLVARGATVAFEVMPALKAFLRSLPGPIQLIGRGEPLPPADYHCPLASLPLAFDTQLATIPAKLPYLAPDPGRVARWTERLHPLPGLRVGIAWQGSVAVERFLWARGRSIPLAALAPLADVQGVSFVCLQKGAGLEQLSGVSFRDRVADFSLELDSGADAFVDTAAVMANLDLVITSDTAIAHVAGALARPVWVALNASPDWRWLLDRADCPWYPSMRLFRQPGPGSGWEPVVADMLAELASLATQRVR